MIGRYGVTVETKDIKYELEFKRKITVISGDSATGKTKLLDLITIYNRSVGSESGIKLSSDAECVVVTRDIWNLIISMKKNCLIFIDDDSFDISSLQSFSKDIKESDNYFIIISRQTFTQLPYSYKEIYDMTGRNRYKKLTKRFKDDNDLIGVIEDVDMILVEDSNSGLRFYKEVSRLPVTSTNGKTNIINFEDDSNHSLVIADGAAIGSDIEKLIDKGFKMYLPESFEFLLLKGLFKGKLKDDFFERTENYIDSKDYFSWELFFTSFLKDITKDTAFHYSKSMLNKVYLQEENINLIKSVMNKKVVEILSGSESEFVDILNWK